MRHQLTTEIFVTPNNSELERLKTIIQADNRRFNAMRTGIVIHSSDGTIIKSNVAAEELLGLTQEQMAGRTSIDPRWRAIHKDGTNFPGETHPAMVALQTGQPVYDVVMGIHKPNTELVWILVTAEPVLTETGEHEIVVSFTNIQKQITLEKTLASSNKRYQILAENASDVVFQLDEDLTIEWISDSIYTSLGWHPKETIGISALVFLHPDDVEDVSERIEAIKNGHPQSFQTRLQNVAGEYQWVHVIAKSTDTTDAGTDVAGYVGSWRDISKEHEIEELRILNEQNIKEIAENAGDFASRVSADGIITWVSQTVSSVLGWQPIELLGHKSTDFVHPDMRHLWEQTIKDATAKTLISLRIRCLCSDETYKWLSLTIRPSDKTNITDMSIIITFHDITEVKILEEQMKQNNIDMATVLENSSDVVFRSDTKTRIEWVSPSVTEMFGYSPKQLIGIKTTDLIHSDDKKTVTDIQEKIDDIKWAEYEARYRKSNGQYRWCAVTVRSLVDNTGKPIGEIGSVRDIHDKKLIEQALIKSEESLRATIELSLDPYFFLEPIYNEDNNITDFVVTYANTVACEYMHTTKEKLVGAYVLARHKAPAKQYWLKFFHECKTVFETTKPYIADDEAFILPTPRFYDIRIVRTIKSLSCTWRDVTTRHNNQSQLEKQASRDNLTGLPTRITAFNVLSKLLPYSDPESSAAIAFCDLDNFKEINDTFGHSTGDKVLRTICERINNIMRKDDLLARVGGDEILVILPKVYNLNDAKKIAEKIHNIVALPITLSATSTITPHLSIGLTLLNQDDNPDTAINRADRAMYQAKTAGKNQTVAI